MKRKPSKTATGSVSKTSLLDHTNRWREQYNPLRGLNVRRVVSLREAYMRGDMTDVQWTYNSIEMSDADLMALVERRTSAILALDWNVKAVSETRTGFDQKLAEDQLKALRAAYERIDNLYEAIEHLSLASFRGFAHVEKHADAIGVNHLEILDQWNVVRQGLRGPWKINPTSIQTSYSALPAENELNPEDWIIREVPRHINWIGLVKFVRANLGQKDWDAFVEYFGIPGAVITGPPDVPEEKEAEYATNAKAIAQGGSGYLPNGATVQFADSPRGVVPFRDHLRWLQEQLILAGTGGLLTMLAESGSGTLAGGAHSDTFQRIAESEARKISECLQKRFDAAVLDDEFPDKPRLAYFELAANEDRDPADIVDMTCKLSSAGYQVDAEELSEKTGLKLVLKAQPVEVPSLEHRADQGLSNRSEPFEFAQAVASDLKPLADRLARIMKIEDPDILKARLQSLLVEFPQLEKDINADPQAAHVLQASMSQALNNSTTKWSQLTHETVTQS